jgi:hypothetical protein
VRACVDLDEADVLDQPGQATAGGVDGQDAVLGALDHQNRDVDLGQVGTEVGQPGRNAGHAGVGRRPAGDVEARLPGLVADAGATELVDVVEVVEEVFEVGVPVGLRRRHETVEDALVDTLGVVVGLEQERRDRAE